MSGPKISAVELERIKQAELERQRQIELEKLRTVIRSHETIMQKLDVLRIKVSRALEKELNLLLSKGAFEISCNTFAAHKRKLEIEINNLLSAERPSERSAIERQNIHLKEKLISIESAYKEGLSKFAAKISEYEKGQAEIAEHNKFADALSKIEKEERITISSIDFTAQINELAEQYDDLIEECIQLANNIAVSQAERGLLFKLLKELQMENSSVRDSAAYQYKALRGSVLRNIRVFNELYAEYHALFVQLSEMCNNSVSFDLYPKHKITISGLEREIQVLENRIKCEDEASYIRNQLNDVMLKFGYDTVEPLVLRAAGKGKSYLYESSINAVHLYMSETNQIMMEPVGLDSLDVSENANYNGEVVTQNLSDSDRAAIFKDQQEFCEVYKRIVSELEARGIILKSKKENPPDRDKVKQIKVKGKYRKSRTERTVGRQVSTLKEMEKKYK